MRIPTLVLLLAIALSICSSSCTPKQTASTTPDPLSSGEAVEVDVGDHSLQLHCFGSGSPVVVLEHGLGADWTNWGHITNQMPRDIRICAYNRSYEAHTSEEYVQDLHALLTGARLEGPFILVGHHFGGLNVILYAHRFPAEVVGIVLENALHPDQFNRLLAALPPESPNESAGLKTLRQKFGAPSQYGIDLNASLDQARPVKTLGEIPVIVLTSASPNPEWGDIPADIQVKLDQEQQALQKELTRLSSQSTQTIADTNKQVIHHYEPQLVIDTIVKLVQELQLD